VVVFTCTQAGVVSATSHLLHNDIACAADSSHVSLLDLSAVFDSVDHDLLLNVLSRRTVQHYRNSFSWL